MLLPGLIEPHIHLEKAYLLSRMEQEAASLQDAIKMTAEMKRSFTREDMAARSLAVVREAVRSGVTHMRCHAEVDPILGLSAFEAMLELIEVHDPDARRERLGSGPARIEHIAIEVPDVDAAISRLRGLGVRTTADAPLETAGARSYWTLPDTTAGVAYQFLER